MIPQFPEFKKIEITDKEEIENFTKNFPPYSDFNFVSLFCWDVDEIRELSILNGNLVVKSTDDVSGKIFFSFLGVNNVQDTVSKIISYAKKSRLKPVLKNIPQEAVGYWLGTGLKVDIKEDRDNFDYVYSIDDLSVCSGSKYADARNLSNRFTKKYGLECSVRALNISADHDEALLRQLWRDWSGLREKYIERENKAFDRLVAHSSDLELISVMVFVGDKPVAFSINQKIHGQFAISHFAKGNYHYHGVYSFMLQETAKKLKELGCHLLNYEEDLGLPNIRRAKESFRPVSFLRKYSIERKSNLLQSFFHMLK